MSAVFNAVADRFVKDWGGDDESERETRTIRGHWIDARHSARSGLVRVRRYDTPAS
jgi:hypothetical protein